MRNLSIGLLALATLLLACRLASAVTPPGEPERTAQPTRRVIKRLPSATPAAGLTMLEAWQRAEPEVKAWTPDAQLGGKWHCQGQLTENGRCNDWYGLVGSLSRQETGDLHVRNGEVEFEPLDTHNSVVEAVLSTAFVPEGFLDSPAVVQRARAWLAAEGLTEADIQDLTIQSDRNALASCELSSGTAVYILKTRQPAGQICLDPYSGSVVFYNLR
jgi:hypothetical protein